MGTTENNKWAKIEREGGGGGVFVRLILTEKEQEKEPRKELRTCRLARVKGWKIQNKAGKNRRNLEGCIKAPSL